MAEQHDRDPTSIEVTAMWTLVKEPDAKARYAELGVSRLIVPLVATGTFDPLEAVERIAAAG